MANDSEQSLGFIVFASAIVLAGAYFYEGNRPPPTPTVAKPASPPVDTSARLAACNALVDAGMKDGIIRSTSGYRMEVEEVGWAALPFHTKKAVLAAQICLLTNGREAKTTDTAAAYGYRSGRRLLLMTGDGLTME
jgi:hypothetical protein